MKLTLKQIREIINHTKKELKATQQSLAQELGYYQSVGANWSYIAGWTYDGDLVVTVFGQVQWTGGGRLDFTFARPSGQKWSMMQIISIPKDKQREFCYIYKNIIINK